MPEKTQFMTTVDEVVTEDVAIFWEFYQEEVAPILKYRQQLEKQAFDKAYEELLKSEQEA